MPTEVYTISGASDVRNPWEQPQQFSVPSPSSAPPSVSPVVRMQSALRSLGVATGNGQLQAVKADGVVGPATVKAVNLALAQYVGASSVFPRADLTVLRVQQYAGALAAAFEDRTRKSGGTVLEPQAYQKVTKQVSRPLRASGPVVPFTPPSTTEPTAPSDDKKWVWYVVGGAGVLLLLTVAASVMKKRAK